MSDTPQLIDLTVRIGGTLMNYGPPPEEGGVHVVESFGSYEAEYAAIRQRVGILHLPPRGRVELTGEDRLDLLNRLLTQQLADLPAGQARRAMLLNAKGRIIADMIVVHHEDHTVLDVDVFEADPLVKAIDHRLFAEQVTLRDASDDYQHIALHGPAAMALLAAVTGEKQLTLKPWASVLISLAGEPALVYRRDDAGTLGLHLHVPQAAACEVYQQLLDAAGYQPGAQIDAAYAEARRKSLRGRPIGWLAYNTARIEAGHPIFHIDFAEDSLPGETGVLAEAVSFSKGCYPGQEIVARMKNLGHPKRLLVGLKFSGKHMPVAGSQVLAESGGNADASDVIGGITSSTLSPLLGETPIAFAVVKWGHHESGQTVRVPCQGHMSQATVTPLNFLPSTVENPR